MAKYSGPSCRLCRREGRKLFLKGMRCFGGKCAVSRREYAPGQHGQDRVKLSDYAVQLREKQKVKRIYNLAEKQFKLYFKKAERAKGVTGEILLQMIERRLDNILFSLGFALSRTQARQIVRHGHILVNNRRVDIPSALVKVNDIIGISKKEKAQKIIKSNIEIMKDKPAPAWLEIDKPNLTGKVLKLPSRADIGMPIQEQLIVELYSK